MEQGGGVVPGDEHRPGRCRTASRSWSCWRRSWCSRSSIRCWSPVGVHPGPTQLAGAGVGVEVPQGHVVAVGVRAPPTPGRRGGRPAPPRRPAARSGGRRAGSAHQCIADSSFSSWRYGSMLGRVDGVGVPADLLRPVAVVPRLDRDDRPDASMSATSSLARTTALSQTRMQEVHRRLGGAGHLGLEPPVGVAGVRRAAGLVRARKAEDLGDDRPVVGAGPVSPVPVLAHRRPRRPSPRE